MHCSTEDQLTGTIDRYFAGHRSLVLLALDETSIAADLRWEESLPGQRYPHVYRPIRVDEVVEVRRWTGDEGR